MQANSSQPIPQTFYMADREAAKAGLSPLALAYVEDLEKAVRAAELYGERMRCAVHSPSQYAAEMNLNITMSKVNFLAESDTIEPEEELSRESFLALSDAINEEDELPRDVIFSSR